MKASDSSQTLLKLYKKNTAKVTLQKQEDIIKHLKASLLAHIPRTID